MVAITLRTHPWSLSSAFHKKTPQIFQLGEWHNYRRKKQSLTWFLKQNFFGFRHTIISDDQRISSIADATNRCPSHGFITSRKNRLCGQFYPLGSAPLIHTAIPHVIIKFEIKGETDGLTSLQSADFDAAAAKLSFAGSKASGINKSTIFKSAWQIHWR